MQIRLGLKIFQHVFPTFYNLIPFIMTTLRLGLGQGDTKKKFVASIGFKILQRHKNTEIQRKTKGKSG